MRKYFDLFLQFLKGDAKDRDTEFLPAILEVTETPPSPTGRLALWSIIALLVIGLLWAVFGHIDEMAVAEGKIIPSGQIKTVQVKNKSIIKEIRVREGDDVKAGQTLIILDPTSTKADVDNLRKRAAYYQLDIDRLNAELEGAQFYPRRNEFLDARDVEAETMLYRSRQGQYRAELAAAQAVVEQTESALQSSRENYSKYSELYKVAQDKENRLRELFAQNAISEFQLLEQRAQRIELEQNTQIALSSINQAQAELAGAHKKLSNVRETYTKDIMTSLVESRKQLYAIEEELKKADEDSRMTVITAPCDGRVFNLDVHTLGGIVTDAQPLMQIAPADVELECEVWAENKDIGFIREGQDAEVKVETFNFQKFGLAKAEVREISPNASTDEKNQLTYEKYRLLLRITEEPDFGEGRKLVPGMHVSAEIKIKEKRIIDFFLDPFRKYTSEALRER